MKKFDFYGQMVLALPGCILAFDYNGIGIAFAGLVMLGLGLWQLTSTIINLVVGAGAPHMGFFRNNLIIAVAYIVIALLLFNGQSRFDYKIQDYLFIAMMAIPPFLIVRYWLGIGKVYQLWFLARASNEASAEEEPEIIKQ